MKHFSILTILLLGCISLNSATRTVDNSLCKGNQQRLQQVFQDGLKSSDLQSIYYSVINHSSADKTSLCKKLATIYADSKLNDFEKNFYYVATNKQLACAEKLPAALLNQLKSAFDKDFTSTQEMFYSYYAQKSAVPAFFTETVNAKLTKNLQVVLKKDDSLNSLGYGFYMASELGAAFAVDRIEDAIMQADEVDGKMLQFEGGLSITALIVNGAFKLTTSLNKPAPITTEQTKKFATYFLSRRSVTTAKGASVLLEALKTINEQTSLSPIAIRIAGNGQLTPEAPVLKIKITDLLGAALKDKPASVKLTITSKTSNTKLVDGESLAPVAADLTLYKIDLKTKNLPKGTYKVEVIAGEFKQSNLIMTMLGKVRLDKVEVSISEADSQTATKKTVLETGKKLQEMYQLDHQQKIGIKFDLFDATTNKILSVHQAFVKFSDPSGAEIIFIAEQDITKAYKFEMDVGVRANDFASKSGVYSIDLIIGDASLMNSFVRNLGEVTLKFSQEGKKEVIPGPIRQARSEIHHLFREPEKRPPRFFSDLFTGLCLAPIAILFLLWGKLGINVSNFSFSLSTFGFHGGLGAIFALFLCFWLKLNMFETVKYLIPIAIFTFLCGNRVLRYIATKRMEKPEKN
ncbi:unnamed protein product [Diamesa serratosioi]